jgi:hypothetical protein
MIEAEQEYLFIQHQPLSRVGLYILEKAERRLVFEWEDEAPVSSVAPTTPAPSRGRGASK